jgi:ketosteroid isomerase-like protein
VDGDVSDAEQGQDHDQPGSREVVERHLDAVRSGDPVAMAADYGDDSVLIRGDDVYVGRASIEDYFRTLPARLGDGHVEFDALTVRDDLVIVPWRIVGGPADGVSGHDTCIVRDGRIRSQQVRLDDSDF